MHTPLPGDVDVPALYQGHSLQSANLQARGKVPPSHIAHSSCGSPPPAAPQTATVLVGVRLPLSPGGEAAPQGMGGGHDAGGVISPLSGQALVIALLPL